ncbi:MAG TPA: type II toxin-antitoxin system death-on-curing family toxin [Caldithrix abyssi]|uniref:Type II toxin-antitoxin system death-on-curing family toxin n=1 Tax=Caldithrix abyssi TaxID=187145 RepID=A0A7V4U148_CALAY|nr:type II toxin-antitoxin system death-on-curing family toxin [Caldithrix abyssi]
MSNFLTIDELLAIHHIIIKEFGGTTGLRDKASLESALMRPQMGYYKDIIEEAAALMESLAMNHPFVDGNKRIAFFAADTFLRLNGRYIDCDNDEAFQYLMGLFKSHTFRYRYLLDWLRNKVKSL